MSVNPDAVDAALFDELRHHYSDDEIVELGAFIGFNLGYHTFFGTLKFYPLFSPDGRLVSQAESEKLYGAGAGLARQNGGGRMTHIAPLPMEAITDPELRALMAEGEALGVPDDLFPRIVARAPEQAVPLMRALIMSHAKGNVDHRLKEIMRILLARFASDKYFASLRSNKARAMGLTEAAHRRRLLCLRGRHQRASAPPKYARCAMPI